MTTSPVKIKKIGLTGGIGSGKSALAKFFSKMGAPVLDADELARKLREPDGLAAPLIQKRFGTIDRTKLRELISNDPQAKKDLEAILHPLIQKVSEKQLDYLAKQTPTAPFIFYEAALLVEAGRVNDFEKVILVTSPLEERIKRIAARDQCSPEQAKRLIESQMNDSERIKRHPTMIVIENDRNLADLEEKARKVLDQLK